MEILLYLLGDLFFELFLCGGYEVVADVAQERKARRARERVWNLLPHNRLLRASKAEEPVKSLPRPASNAVELDAASLPRPTAGEYVEREDPPV